MIRRSAVVASMFLALCTTVLAQPEPPTPGEPPPQAKPRQPRSPNRGPWDNDLLIIESSDGVKFSPPKVFVERGGVPSITRAKDGRLVAAFQWFPFDQPDSFDRIAIMTSSDDGKTWEKPRTAEFENLPADAIRPCDPTVVLLDDGRLRLYFTSQTPAERNAATYSAISSDGLHYTFEPGVRFAVEGRQVLDCAVARLGKTWHYYAPMQRERGKGYHATSDDGLSFKRVDDVALDGDYRWLGCAVTEGDHLRFYGTGRGVWTAISSDGSTWQLEEGMKASGADPGAAVTQDGRRLLVVTGPPRADAGKNPPPEGRPPVKPPAKPATPRPPKSKPPATPPQAPPD